MYHLRFRSSVAGVQWPHDEVILFFSRIAALPCWWWWSLRRMEAVFKRLSKDKLSQWGCSSPSCSSPYGRDIGLFGGGKIFLYHRPGQQMLASQCNTTALLGHSDLMTNKTSRNCIKTAFCPCFKLFAFNVMPFSLTHIPTPATSWTTVLVYLDCCDSELQWEQVWPWSCYSISNNCICYSVTDCSYALR